MRCGVRGSQIKRGRRECGAPLSGTVEDPTCCVRMCGVRCFWFLDYVVSNIFLDTIGIQSGSLGHCRCMCFDAVGNGLHALSKFQKSVFVI
jgi:hypothetical protein